VPFRRNKEKKGDRLGGRKRDLSIFRIGKRGPSADPERTASAVLQRGEREKKKKGGEFFDDVAQKEEGSGSGGGKARSLRKKKKVARVVLHADEKEKKKGSLLLSQNAPAGGSRSIPEEEKREEACLPSLGGGRGGARDTIGRVSPTDKKGHGKDPAFSLEGKKEGGGGGGKDVFQIFGVCNVHAGNFTSCKN